MKVITTRDLILSVAEKWKKQYGENQYGEDKLIILDKLKNLDLRKASKKTIDGIIGNSSWTNIKCDECNKYVDKIIQIGEEPDYESCTANVCIRCLKKAINLTL